jgi:hypothetical protein
MADRTELLAIRCLIHDEATLLETGARLFSLHGGEDHLLEDGTVAPRAPWTVADALFECLLFGPAPEKCGFSVLDRYLL